MSANLHAYQTALRAAQAADDTWTRLLQIHFGRHAGDARYDARGRGEDGSLLRLAYDAHRAACNAWQATRELGGNIDDRSAA